MRAVNSDGRYAPNLCRSTVLRAILKADLRSFDDLVMREMGPAPARYRRAANPAGSGAVQN
jgi:hypothetical protein